MAPHKVIMVLQVDLRCPSCYKEIKKLLCKFPQIQDQVYDERKNTVTITVVCCSPENIRDKLCCKGGKVIKSIEIKPPPTPKEPEKPKTPEKPEKRPADKPVPTPAPIPVPAPKEPEPAPKAPEPASPPTVPAVPGCGTPSIFLVPVDVCCGPCYEGRAGGPCYHGYGRPVPCYDNYGYNSYGYGPCGAGRRCHVSRCGDYDYCFNEENASACTIM